MGVAAALLCIVGAIVVKWYRSRRLKASNPEETHVEARSNVVREMDGGNDIKEADGIAVDASHLEVSHIRC